MEYKLESATVIDTES